MSDNFNSYFSSSGSKETLKERASRYAASAGSEEIELLPDDQENDENQ
ncbi:unnamed protein product, partial [Rotaria magnacalcarata]